MTTTGRDLLAAHAAFMASGFASATVVIGSVRTRGLLDDEETLATDDSGYGVRVRRRVLTVATEELADLPARDSTLTVDGVSYTVRSAERRGDGRHTEIEVVATNG